MGACFVGGRLTGGFGLVLAAVMFSGVHAQAEIITIGANRDNTLFEDETGTLSNGAGISIFAGTTARHGLRRGLLSFKMQDYIPEGAIITRAELTLYCDRGHGANTMMGMHAATASWGEGLSFTGLGAGTQAERGDATWTNRFYEIGPNWTNPGGDFVENASSIIAVSGAFRSYTWGGAGMVADVQRWVDDPSSNFGWLLKAENETTLGQAKRFISREGDPEGRRPRLLIEYTVVPTPASFAVAIMTGLLSLRRRHR